MAEQQIIGMIMSFGLAENSAKTYLFLLKAGPIPARTIVNKLGTNRVDVYRTLKALEERGLVEVTLGRPAKFVATPVETAIDRHIEELKARISDVESKKEEIVKYCRELAKAIEVIEEPRFRVLQGREQIYDLLLKMFDNAETNIGLITTENDLQRLALVGLGNRLRKMRRKGVKSRLLTQVNSLGLEIRENFLDLFEVRHITLPTPMRFAVRDENETLTTFAMNDSMSMKTQEDTGLWTNAPNYVKAMETSFNALWESGVPVQEILQSLKSKQMLVEGLELAKKILGETGWTSEVPGKVSGESGVEHTFALTAKHQNHPDKLLVLDLLAEKTALPQILALTIKSVDVKPVAKILVTAQRVDKEENKLAKFYRVELIHVTSAKQLAGGLRKEANKLLDS